MRAIIIILTCLLAPNSFVWADEAESAQHEGVGLLLTAGSDGVKVIGVVVDSAAEQAGLRFGDVINTINGHETKGLSLSKACSLLRGPAGTSVKVSFTAASDQKVKSVTLKRHAIDPAKGIWRQVEDVRVEIADVVVDWKDIARQIPPTPSNRYEAGTEEEPVEGSDKKTTKHPRDVRKLLDQANVAGALPAGVVVRVQSQMSWKTGSSNESKFSESWEFTSDKVHRIVREVKDNKVIYRRDKSFPFDSERLCRDLADGRILEIRDNKGPGEPLRFALAFEGWDHGERNIEILVDETPVIRLGESHLSPGYLEPHARNFATLYEKLASQARAVFEEIETRKFRETLLEASRKETWPKGMVVRLGADAFHPHKDWKLVENWGFTEGKVHRIIPQRAGKNEIVWRQEKSLPFDTSKICKLLVNGRAFELQVNNDSIEESLLLAVLFCLCVPLKGAEKKPRITDPVVEQRFRTAIKKPTGELTQADLEKEIWRLDFRFAPITDEGLREVFKIKQVKDPLFNRTARITDAGLQEVANLKQLEGLSLMQTQITDAGLTKIANLRKIEGLNLQSTKVTSAGLVQLLKAWNQPGEGGGEGASKLRYLLLDNCPGIDDVALKEISQHRHLEGLQLGGTAVTDAGLKELADHKQLTSLSLGGTQITDEGLKEVAKLQQLTSLSVGGTQITDAGLKQIVKLKNLQRLSLGAKVTNTGLALLEKALPKCRIRYNGQDPHQRAKDLDDFEAKLKADPQYLMGLLAEDRDKGEALLRAGQKQRPTARPWAMDIQMLFAGDVFTGKSLQWKEKVAHFKHALEYLQESYDIAVQTLDKAHDDELQAALPGLQIDLALAALEAGQVDSAKKHAAETLRNNADRKNWNYGNIVHNTNQILGRCALREGKLTDAKTYLLKAGATPGSPQLNSFGPQMQLARELLEKDQKETVLQYLDLVARFWANPDERTEANSKRTAREHLNQLEAWKKQLRAGKVPDHTNWK